MKMSLFKEKQLLPTSLLPVDKQIAVERWIRGRKDFARLRRAENVVVSFGKSGRTWLRVMVSRFYQQRYGLPEHSLIKFDNFRSKDKAIPLILFTHDNYIRDYTKHHDSKVDFYEHKVVVLARHPVDVAVSQYFQWKHRMTPIKRLINQYPTNDTGLSMFEFARNPGCGLPKIVEFLNQWEREIPNTRAGMILRYEDLKSEPHEAMAKILAFFGTPGSPEEVRDAVEYGAYDNMRKLESVSAFGKDGRMRPGDRNNPDSFKVRRGKVGGYRDYFDAEQVAWLDEFVRSRAGARVRLLRH